MSATSHDSVAAIAQWGRTVPAKVLARLGAPFDPLPGVYQVPDEKMSNLNSTVSAPCRRSAFGPTMPNRRLHTPHLQTPETSTQRYQE